MDKVDLIQELRDLINKNVDAADFPYKKGNSIRIGAYAIRKKKNNYIVIDCMTNKIIEQCFSKAAAIALAKRLAKGKSIDKLVEKNLKRKEKQNLKNLKKPNKKKMMGGGMKKMMYKSGGFLEPAIPNIDDL